MHMLPDFLGELKVKQRERKNEEDVKWDLELGRATYINFRSIYMERNLFERFWDMMDQEREDYAAFTVTSDVANMFGQKDTSMTAVSKDFHKIR